MQGKIIVIVSSFRFLKASYWLSSILWKKKTDILFASTNLETEMKLKSAGFPLVDNSDFDNGQVKGSFYIEEVTFRTSQAAYNTYVNLSKLEELNSAIDSVLLFKQREVKVNYIRDLLIQDFKHLPLFYAFIDYLLYLNNKYKGVTLYIPFNFRRIHAV